jgi:gamma-glutamyltranspeptidase/glutathione hydrolase
VVPGISAGIASVAGAFREHWPSSAEVYLADGVPAPGTRLANPVLAATYQRLLDEAEAAGPAGRRRSRRPATPSTRASWPRRSGRT